MIPSVLLFVTRLALGTIFVLSGFAKLPDLRGFSLIVMQYGIVRAKFSRFIGYTLPFFEAGLGFSLLIWANNVWLAAVALILLMGVTWALVQAKRKAKISENCGCFGTMFRVPVKRKVRENLVLIAIAVFYLVAIL